MKNLSKINPIIRKLNDGFLSDTIAKQSKESMSKMTEGSLSEKEEEDVSHSEEKEGLSGTDSSGTELDLKDMGSNKVINLSHVNLLIETLIDDIIGGVISKQGKEIVPLMTDSSSSEEEEEEDISASGDGPVSPCSNSHGIGVYFKDFGVNKVTHIHNEAAKEIPCLTSDSESDVGEEERMPAAPSEWVEEEVGKSILEDVKDRLSKYFKDRESNQVFTFNKCQKLSNLKSAIKSDFKLVVEDSDSQYGDDENEEEEDEEKKEEQRTKTLPRGRGGAGQWEKLAEQERLRMVAKLRNKMVTIAIQVHIQGNNKMLSYHSFYRLLIMRGSKFDLQRQIVQKETVSLSPPLTNATSSTVVGLSQASPF